MRLCDFVMSGCRDFPPLVIVGEIVIELSEQIFPAFVVNKILTGHEKFQQIRLVIRQHKTARPHHVKDAHRDTRHDRTQRHV